MTWRLRILANFQIWWILALYRGKLHISYFSNGVFLMKWSLWYNKKKIWNNRSKFLQYWPLATLLHWVMGHKKFEPFFCNTKLAPVLLGQFHLHLSFKQTKSRSGYSTSWNTRLDVGPFQPCCHFWHKDR